MSERKTIIIITAAGFLIVGLMIAGYFYWGWVQKNTTKFVEEAGDIKQDTTNSASKGVLPSLGINPLASKPNVNPAENANPIKNIKTNPFE
ncbi:MAG TPA: hypothetical protein DDW36_02470 [Candidatus Magasanikbacteria bacterium]|nr:hypothetical protein [Candidatus Magasanikbacteria bacterium]